MLPVESHTRGNFNRFCISSNNAKLLNGPLRSFEGLQGCQRQYMI